MSRESPYLAPLLLLEFLIVELGVRHLGVLEHMLCDLGGGDVLAPQDPAEDEVPYKCKWSERRGLLASERERRMI
jgi:hypothetical protein